MILFTENLRFLLEEKKWDEKTLSRKTGIPESDIEKITNSESQANLQELVFICKALSISTDKMLCQDLSARKKLLDNFDFKMLALDIDGVMTDGGMYYSENGDELKKFNTKDGMAIKKLTASGNQVGFISSGINASIIERRAELLGVKLVYVGTWKKIEILTEWCEKLGIGLENVAYVGDDINDCLVMEQVGLSACPSDAVERVKNRADIILSRKGGKACVREFIETYLMTVE